MEVDSTLFKTRSWGHLVEVAAIFLNRESKSTLLHHLQTRNLWGEQFHCCFFPVRSSFNLGFMTTFWTSEDYENIDKLNATIQAEVTHLEAPLSSTVALIIVLMIIFSLVMTSFMTYCFHKWRLKGHKLQTAQEEYQRDHEKYIFQSFPDLIT